MTACFFASFISGGEFFPCPITSAFLALTVNPKRLHAAARWSTSLWSLISLCVAIAAASAKSNSLISTSVISRFDFSSFQIEKRSIKSGSEVNSILVLIKGLLKEGSKVNGKESGCQDTTLFNATPHLERLWWISIDLNACIHVLVKKMTNCKRMGGQPIFFQYLLLERFPAHSIKGLCQINKGDEQWFSLFPAFSCSWRSINTYSLF